MIFAPATIAPMRSTNLNITPTPTLTIILILILTLTLPQTNTQAIPYANYLLLEISLEQLSPQQMLDYCHEWLWWPFTEHSSFEKGVSYSVYAMLTWLHHIWLSLCLYFPFPSSLFSLSPLIHSVKMLIFLSKYLLSSLTRWRLVLSILWLGSMANVCYSKINCLQRVKKLLFYYFLIKHQTPSNQMFFTMNHR